MSASLFVAPTVNFKQTTLNGSITDSVTTIPITNATNIQSPGYVVIDRTNSSGTATPTAREVVTFTGISGNSLTGCTRGADGSTAQAHVDGAIVETMPTVGMWNSLATIVAQGFTNDGYLKPIASPASIAIMYISTHLNASGASVEGITTSDPLIVKQLAVTSIASVARAEFRTMALQSVASTTIPEFGIVNADGNIVINPGTNKSVGLKETARFKVYRGSAQSIATGGWTKIQFATEAYDTGSNFDAATNYRFTAPIKGVYGFKAALRTTGMTAAKSMAIAFYVDGATIGQHEVPSDAGGNLGLQTATDILLNASQYVEVFCYNNDAGSINIEGARQDTFFCGHLLSAT